MKLTNFLTFGLFLCLLSCSTTGKKAQETADKKASKKNDIYTCIHKIAEALPLTQQEASDFFANLDSVKLKKFRNAPNQQFQYKFYTVFYEQPGKGKLLRGVGIDLDTTSHVNMKHLGEQLNAKWHSADLIEIKAGKVHYSTEYVDSTKKKKQIHITIGLSDRESEKENEITFIGIDSEKPQKISN